MKSRIRDDSVNKIAVDINELKIMLSVGRDSAAAIGEKAGAVIRVGRRKLYNVQKVSEYMYELTAG